MIAAFGIRKYFNVKQSMLSNLMLKAVDGVDLKIRKGEIFGLVGESGSGKTTLGRILVGLLEPTEGDVLFDVDEDVTSRYENALLKGDKEELEALSKKYSIFKKRGNNRKILRRKMNIVFQDPYSSLDPRMRIIDIVKEPMIATDYLKGEAAEKRVLDLLEEVGLGKSFAQRYPHELSGGQRQRVAIARALATEPEFVVLDEPTSALDVSVQAQILNLLKKLKQERELTMLLITHNIAVVSYMADRVGVMYAGKLMEVGDKIQVLKNPKHPYTVSLISAVPQPKPRSIRQRIVLKGEPPNLIFLPRGCIFHPRCPFAFEECGWSTDEIVDDLSYLISSKYYESFGESVSIRTKDENTIIIENAKAELISEIVEKEKANLKSLTAIKKITQEVNYVEIKIHDFITPELYKLDDGRKVACLLFRAEEKNA